MEYGTVDQFSEVHAQSSNIQDCLRRGKMACPATFLNHMYRILKGIEQPSQVLLTVACGLRNSVELQLPRQHVAPRMLQILTDPESED